MSTKKKVRQNPARSPKSKFLESNMTSAEGIYSNSYFMNAVVALVGSSVKVHTASGTIYEGILKTFSPSFDVVVELAHKVDPSNSMHICLDSVVRKMVFKQAGIVKIAVTDQDLDYATRDTFQTDAAISKFNGQLGEKELEPWDSNSACETDCDLEGVPDENGWDVRDMFRVNQERFDVASNFDPGLEGYTIPLQKESKNYKEVEARASKIASEIESSAYYKNRIELENGDEEEKYAAVVRPSNHYHHSNNGNKETNNNSSNSVSSGDSGPPSNKYVPPPKRKMSTQSKVSPSASARTSSSSPPHQPVSNQQQPHNVSPPGQQTAVQNSQTKQMPVASASAGPLLNQANREPANQQHSSQSGRENQQHSSANRERERTETSARDRTNGGPLYESPKPQRVNSNIRHGRNFVGAESSRSSNGNLSSPSAPAPSEPQPQQQTAPQHHHRNSPRQYVAVAGNQNEHKPHNPGYNMPSQPPLVASPAPPVPAETHHRMPSGPYAHHNNQQNDYRNANQQHSPYVHNHVPSANSVSPSLPNDQQQQYIQRGGAQHYAGNHPIANVSTPTDLRGAPHFGGPIPYTVPILAAPTTVVEMRGPAQVDCIDQQQQMVPPQPPVVQQHQCYRKPPIVSQHAVIDHAPPPPSSNQAAVAASQNSLQKAQARRLKDASELKSFAHDFKLAEPDEIQGAMGPKRSPHGQQIDSNDENSRVPHEQNQQAELHNQQSQQQQQPQGNSRSAPNKEPPKAVVNSKLNPNAKEFVYNPAAKPFTPAAMSTPSQSRPHTPQTPSAGYAPMPPPPQASLGHPIQMMMPAYVVTAQPPYPQPPTQQTRFHPKVHMGVASQPSQMSVAAATGQPLLAPAPLPQFTVPYPPQGYLPSPYQQMVRMVQHGDGMPPMIAAINFPGPDGAPGTAPMPFMTTAPPPPPPQQQQQHAPQHPPILHHHHQQQQQNNGSSPQSNGNNQMYPRHRNVW